MSAPPEIGGLPVTVVRHPRARRWKLSLQRGGRGLRLSIPPRASEARALAWARDQHRWAVEQAARQPSIVALTDGSEVALLGVPTRIEHRAAGRRGVVHDGDRLVVTCPPERIAATLLAWLRRLALATLSADTAEFAMKAGVRVTGVGVGDPRSRWGSCSAGGAIRYSWRLILAPPWVRRATVAHEVAHRLHMDHSPRFHAALAELAECDPAEARAWLRTHGAVLHGFGA